ncbi:hypothetical protein NSK_000020 [Nannochloropsis salina CCMP1776]|uniref:Ribosomal silencing factor RsfS n=1 Tax=Nannochloropsis salina CCMP1776 TaxID=1027361 RepID=A0A4D9DAV6_9STRA|nr:hypothetical protein NSK_000020 [Nannochloropsis salina CCMP1776]|eukprot:TFJ88446.1 hypothetical protein NSK_000020 [Nannochloropsis salina CCMP1776]
MLRTADASFIMLSTTTKLMLRRSAVGRRGTSLWSSAGKITVRSLASDSKDVSNGSRGRSKTSSSSTVSPSWPPSRQEMARMFEAGYESYEKNERKGMGRSAMAWKEDGRDEAGAQEGSQGGAGGGSLSPHHDGYDATEMTRQRIELSKATTAAALARTDAKYLNEEERKAHDAEMKALHAGIVSGGGGEDPDDSPSATGGGQPWLGRKTSRAGAIPVLPRTLLTPAEVVEALVALGGEDVASVDIRGKGNFNAEAMIFASGRSGGHLRRMADTVVGALKARGIEEMEAPGVTGAEGYDCEDWMIVDGGNVIVHLMEPSQRAALGLEGFWGEGEGGRKGGRVGELVMPVAATASEEAWSQAHDALLERYPVDEEYAPEREEEARRERELRRVLGPGGKGMGERRRRRKVVGGR